MSDEPEPLIRDARPEDLPAVVDIYNASIPGRLATADLRPVTVDDRRAWFAAHTPDRRPLWIAWHGQEPAGWLSFTDFYEGRPAYQATAEISVYVAPGQRRRGVGRHLLTAAIARAQSLGVTTLLAFIFDHNAPSLRLFERAGFTRWGHLPRIAELDGVERGVVLSGLRPPARGAASG